MPARRAATLIEAVIVAALSAMLILLTLPALDGLRTEARLAGSRDNLATLGKAAAGYTDANQGMIAGYDWDEDDAIGEPGIFGGLEYDIGGGEVTFGSDSLEIAQIQQAAILRRATGRFENPGGRIWVDRNRFPFRRFLHLPLADYLSGTVFEPAAVSPLDVNLQAFQQNPLAMGELPGGDPDFAADGTWTNTQTVRRWPFTASYLSTNYAWSPSRPLPGAGCTLSIEPAGEGTLTLVNDPDALRPQPLSDVAFPANKSFLFEEFDYRDGLGVNGRWFGDRDASVNVLFFDGSARLVPTEDANPGWDASRPDDMFSVASTLFEPIDTRYFPTYPPDTFFNMPHRWTRGGLEGIDVGAGEVNTKNWCD